MPSVSETRNRLADLIGRVQYGGERVVIEKRGKPVAVLVNVEDWEAIERLEDKLLLEMAEEAHEEHLKNPDDVISHEELWTEIEANLDDE